MIDKHKYALMPSINEIHITTADCDGSFTSTRTIKSYEELRV